MTGKGASGDAAPPRYSTRPLPPYRYIPGRAPHPLRDPAGHSHGAQLGAAPEFDPARWARSEALRYAVDLFNHGYYWEAHEALEGLWVAVGRHTPAGRFLQGLIQVAVGQLKAVQGHRDAAARLTDEGLAKLGAAPMFGVDPRALRPQVEARLAGRGPPPRITLALPEDGASRS